MNDAMMARIAVLEAAVLALEGKIRATGTERIVEPATEARENASPRNGFVIGSDGIAPFMQPAGVCPSCDRRRKALNSTKTKRRAREAPIGAAP